MYAGSKAAFGNCTLGVICWSVKCDVVLYVILYGIVLMGALHLSQGPTQVAVQQNWCMVVVKSSVPTGQLYAPTAACFTFGIVSCYWNCSDSGMFVPRKCPVVPSVMLYGLPHWSI